MPYHRNVEKCLRRINYSSLTGSKPGDIKMQIEHLQRNLHWQGFARDARTTAILDTITTQLESSWFVFLVVYTLYSCLLLFFCTNTNNITDCQSLLLSTSYVFAWFKFKWISHFTVSRPGGLKRTSFDSSHKKSFSPPKKSTHR